MIDNEPTLDRWWLSDPHERYWLEVSDRANDLGLDLNAPTTNEVGRPFWSYDLLGEVGEGDVILHYDRSDHAIVAWSVAVGEAWLDDVVWAARGTSARGRNIQPHRRPGRRVSLRGPTRLRVVLGLARLRAEQERLLVIRGDRPYFPFELGSRATRPMQGYLFKLPAAFLDVFAELNEVPRGFSTAAASLEDAGERVLDPHDEARPRRPAFQPRNEEVRSRAARPWARDPSEVDRALSSHARIERLVAEPATAAGWVASSYGLGDPVFDLLLERMKGEGPAVVVEAKSTVASNEEKQLRLALGQVLRYRQLLARSARDVRAMIAVEREPADPGWHELCTDAGVLLAWPEVVQEQLRQLT